MTTANQIIPGMTLNIDGKIFRVESCIKVTVAKANPFMKTKLRNLVTDETIEKNFKLDQNFFLTFFPQGFSLRIGRTEGTSYTSRKKRLLHRIR